LAATSSAAGASSTATPIGSSSTSGFLPFGLLGDRFLARLLLGLRDAGLSVRLSPLALLLALLALVSAALALLLPGAPILLLRFPLRLGGLVAARPALLAALLAAQLLLTLGLLLRFGLLLRLGRGGLRLGDPALFFAFFSARFWLRFETRLPAAFSFVRRFGRSAGGSGAG
jgi:hypothetical protein